MVRNQTVMHIKAPELYGLHGKQCFHMQTTYIAAANFNKSGVFQRELDHVSNQCLLVFVPRVAIKHRGWFSFDWYCFTFKKCLQTGDSSFIIKKSASLIFSNNHLFIQTHKIKNRMVSAIKEIHSS